VDEVVISVAVVVDFVVEDSGVVVCDVFAVFVEDSVLVEVISVIVVEV
jgi:hypothetical protein